MLRTRHMENFSLPTIFTRQHCHCFDCGQKLNSANHAIPQIASRKEKKTIKFRLEVTAFSVLSAKNPNFDERKKNFFAGEFFMGQQLPYKAYKDTYEQLLSFLKHICVKTTNCLEKLEKKYIWIFSRQK